jgi:hypothetical protein
MEFVHFEGDHFVVVHITTQSMLRLTQATRVCTQLTNNISVIVPYRFGVRTYATQTRNQKKPNMAAQAGYTQPQPAASRMKISVYSLADIADPFLPEIYTKNKPLMSWAGLKARWQTFIKKITTLSSLLRIKKNYSGKFPLFKFVQNYALDLFKEVHTATAKRDISKLRRICTDSSLTDAKKLMKQNTTQWNLESVKEAKVVNATIVDLGQMKKSFAQITVKFVTTQKIDDQVQEDQVEYMVFERGVFDQTVRDSFG